MSPRALICGISGQDGTYLARLLLEKGYEVYGTSRDAYTASLSNLRKFNIHDRIRMESMAIIDSRSVFQVINRIVPDEIYNLSGQTSVGLSFDQPVEAFESIAVGTLNLLEAMRIAAPEAKLFNASSSECFGDTLSGPATETTAFHPRSPYGVAKCTAHWTAVNYREAYGLFVSCGILSNHESPLRPRRFVTQKIISGACSIAKEEMDTLRLGNLSICRDWGWAEDYVEAMHLLLSQDSPDDYIVSTGQTHSLEDFVRLAFEHLDLDWRDHVKLDESLQRPSDLIHSELCPDKIRDNLGWEAKYHLEDIIEMMIHAYQDSDR